MNGLATFILAVMLSAFSAQKSNAGTPSPLPSSAPETDTPDHDTLAVVFTGDILLDRGVRAYLAHGGMRRVIPDETASVLRSADFVVGNLECPATTVQSPAFKRFVFRAEPQWLDSLRAYGFTHLNLANNHSVDQGRQGLRDTRRNILRAGLVPIGADSTMHAAAQPVSLNAFQPSGKHCRKVYLLASNRLPLESFAYLPDHESISQEPLDSLLHRVRTLRHADSTAVIVVNLHWGIEHTPHPRPQQRMEAHALVDAGADVIIGHHPHTRQSVEQYKDKTICYSLGNFIFDQQQPMNKQACIVRLRITENKVETDIIPVTIDHCAPRVDHH